MFLFLRIHNIVYKYCSVSYVLVHPAWRLITSVRALWDYSQKGIGTWEIQPHPSSHSVYTRLVSWEYSFCYIFQQEDLTKSSQSHQGRRSTTVTAQNTALAVVQHALRLIMVLDWWSKTRGKKKTFSRWLIFSTLQHYYKDTEKDMSHNSCVYTV